MGLNNKYSEKHILFKEKSIYLFLCYLSPYFTKYESTTKKQLVLTYLIYRLSTQVFIIFRAGGVNFKDVQITRTELNTKTFKNPTRTFRKC